MHEEFPQTGFNIVNSGYDKSISDFVWHLHRKRVDYYLTCVTEGAVTYILNDKTFKAKKGDFFLYHPNEIQDFTFETYSHTTTHWVHFIGNKCDELINQLNLKSGKIVVKSEKPKKLLLQLINEMILKKTHYETLAKSLLAELLINLSREIPVANKEDSTQKNEDLFLTVLERITKDPKISNKECADICCLSVSQFVRSFKKKFGVTPHQMKITTLINVSKDLLIHGNMSITSIAESLGFYSENLYFNSLFKKQTGLSPTEYRNKYKGEQPNTKNVFYNNYINKSDMDLD